VATYSDPSVYRVGRAELQSITDELDPESPQRAILADGRVSRTEVDRAWQDYEACMRRAGFVLTRSSWDPVTTTTRIFTYARAGAGGAPAAATRSTAPTRPSATTPRTTPPTTPTTTPTTTPPSTPLAPPSVDAMSDTEAEQVDACEETYWFPVSAVYAADTPPHMEPPLAAAVEACMVRRGYAVHGATDFGAMVGAVRGQARGARVQAGRDCLATALPALYPDLPYYPRP
jgi:hypothetical protein